MSTNPLTLSELWKKVESVKIGMFATLDANGNINSRPMTKQEVDDEGILWFFTSLHSDIARELTAVPQVNVSFAEPKDGFYASLAGRATLITDRTTYARLWNPVVKAWFPRGIDDPELALIQFHADSAEYWDADSSRMVQMLKLAKAAVTGTGVDRDDFGRHGNIQI
jgi:general stress protein 26